jgi:glycosyltransferase involved in cell wall biosynthesis
LVRILEIAPLVAPIDERRTELGGAQILLQDLSRGLASRGHHVSLAAAKGSFVSGVDVVPIDVDTTRMRKADLGSRSGPRPDDDVQRDAFKRVRGWIDVYADDIDVIHAHAYDAPAFAALRGAPRPVVHTLHLPPLDDGVVEAARDATDATLVTVSSANADAWRRRGVPIAHVVPNGVDIGQIPIGQDRGEHLLFAGRISPEKGVATALDIADRARRGILIVGSVYDEAYFAKQIAPRVRAVPGAQPRRQPLRGAIYIGPRAREEVYELMGHAAVTLMPVEWDEPFGLVAVESLAAGTPVVASRRGGLVDIIDGRSGALVESGDVAAFAAEVERVAGADPAECRRSALRFSLDRMLSAYENVLASVVHGVR